jgi:hypothetical protein
VEFCHRISLGLTQSASGPLTPFFVFSPVTILLQNVPRRALQRRRERRGWDRWPTLYDGFNKTNRDAPYSFALYSAGWYARMLIAEDSRVDTSTANQGRHCWRGLRCRRLGGSF